jgi:hypothetical protein
VRLRAVVVRLFAILLAGASLAGSPAAAFEWGRFFGGEGKPSPQEHPWTEGVGPASDEDIRALGVGSDLAETIRSRTSGDPALLRGAAEGTPVGLVWPVGPTTSTSLVRDLREDLAGRGFAFFVARRRFGTGADEVGLVKGVEPLDLLERFGTPGPRARITTEDVRRRLDEWTRIAEWSLLGVGADWIEIDFDPVPAREVLARILEDASRLAPSAVPADVETRERLRARVAAERRLLLFWD